MHAEAEPSIIPNRMTREQWDERRAELDRAYGPNAKSAGVRREQEFAKFYAESGWNQREIAEKEDISQSHIGKMLKFGSFLSFLSSRELKSQQITALSNTLAEKTFRRLWAGTDGGNDYTRFEQVLTALEQGEFSEKGRMTNTLGKDIVERFSDGKYHKLEDVIEATGKPEALVRAAIEKLEGSKNQKIETKPNGKGFKLRIFKNTDPVPFTELQTKLMPIIERMESEGKKHVALIVPSAFADCAHLLRKLLAEWDA